MEGDKLYLIIVLGANILKIISDHPGIKVSEITNKLGSSYDTGLVGDIVQVLRESNNIDYSSDGCYPLHFRESVS